MTDKPVKLEEIISGLPVAVICVDRDDDYTLRFANAEAARMLGYDIDDFLHNKRYAAATVVHPDDLVILERADAQQDDNGSAMLTRYRLVAADGSIVPVLDVSRAMVDQDGNVTSYLSVLVDLRNAPALQGPSQILVGTA